MNIYLQKNRFTIWVIGAVMLLTSVRMPQVQAQTIRTVGTGGNYTTLKLAFDAINDGTLTGAIELQLISNITGITTDAVLNGSGVGAAVYSSVAIYPTNPSGVLLEGNFTGAIIRLEGADNVTIDGRVNRSGSTVDLTIRNLSTNATTPNVGAVMLINGASNNTIRYCRMIFHGGNITVAQGSLVIAPSTSGTGSNDNIIEFCHFNGGATANLRPSACITVSGATGFVNERLIIRNNQFYDYIKATINSRGINIINEFNSFFIIEENSFYNTSPLVVEAASVNHAFIAFQGPNHTVRNNYIGGSGPNLTGTFSLPSTTLNRTMDLFGIAPTAANNALIEENNIGRFDVFLGGGFFQVIRAQGGSVTVRNNNIGSENSLDNIMLSKAFRGLGFDFVGIWLSSTGNATVSGNKISGISSRFWDPATGAASNQGRANIIGIFNQRGTTVLVEDNVIGGVLANSIHAKSLSVGPFTGTGAGTTDISDEQVIVGIENTGTGNGITIRNNTIQNLVNASQNTERGYVQGIRNLPGSSGTLSIQGNSIENLKISNNNKTLGGGASVAGISNLTSNTANISGNFISGLVNDFPGFEGEMNGIHYASLNGRAVSGNFIKDLHPSSSLNATVNGIRIDQPGSSSGIVSNNIINFRNLKNSTNYRGITDLSSGVGATVQIYFNTIVFTGSSRANGFSYALFSNSSLGKNYRNNNLYNAVENSGTGINAALGFGPFATLPAAGALDYNNYFVTGSSIGTTQFLVDNNGTTYTDLASWRTASSRDANSLNLDPQFNSATGSLPTDFRVRSTSLAGVAISGITTDYTGLTRATTPTIGALEYTVTLPVVWVSFSARAQQGASVELTWQTASEENNKGFVVQRSVNGTDFTSKGFVAARGNGMGAQYRFIDHQAPAGRIFYRLLQQDYNGNNSLSAVRAVVVQPQHSIQLTPNPATTQLQVNGIGAVVAFHIINTKGVVLRTGLLRAGSNYVDVTQLPPGMYYLRIMSGTEQKIVSFLIAR